MLWYYIKIMKTFSRIFISGLCGVAAGGFIFCLMYLFPYFSSDSKELILLFFPVLYGAAFGLGLRATPATHDETVTTLTTAILITVIIYFVAGVAVSEFFRKIIKPRGKKTIVGFFIVVILFISGFLFYESRVSYAGETVASCQGFSFNKLKKGFSTADCLNAVSKVANDSSACEQIPQNDYRRRGCVMNVAWEKMDYKICDLLSDQHDKKSCLSQVAATRGECSVLDTNAANYCYLYRSQTIRTSARDNRCDTFRTDLQDQYCEEFRRGNVTIQDLCKNITDATLKNECLHQSIGNIKVNYSN